MSWDTLDADRLSDLDAREFEDFAYDLCCFEAYERSQDPKMFGPTGIYRSDGGRGFSIEIRKPLLVSKLEYQQKYYLSPLTEDDCVTAYSCKTGATWWTKAKKDAKDDSRLKRGVEVLASGGYFKLLTNQLTPPLDVPKVEDGHRDTLFSIGSDTMSNAAASSPCSSGPKRLCCP